MKCCETEALPFALVNLDQETLRFERAACIGTLMLQDIDISEILTETAQSSSDEGYETEEDHIKPNVQSLFITSPATIEVHRKMDLVDAEVDEEYKRQLEALCKEYEDIVLSSSKDISHTPLIQMDIDTGDSPPVCQ